MAKQKNQAAQPEEQENKPAKAPKRTRVKDIDKAVEEQETPYVLPRGCELDQVRTHILRYQCFEHERRVYMMRDKVAVAVSNFICTIHTHMDGSKSATKLITVQNEDKERKTYEVESNDLLTLLPFRKITAGLRGNYHWEGTESDYMRYLKYMQDHMGVGRKITVLGKQPEGFWCFNNAAVPIGGKPIPFDDHGCFSMRNGSYYVPAGNKIFEDDETSEPVGKLVTLVDSAVTFEQWNRQLRIVHRNHAMLATCFTLATAFSDIIFARLRGFPMLYLYGAASSGKDQLIEACSTVFGQVQPSVSLNGNSTEKGKLRMISELRNMPFHLAEYRASMKKETLDLLKDIWDRRPMRRANKDQGVGTNWLPIRGTVFLSGNDYPNQDDAVMTRIMVLVMNKSKHTVEERMQYEALARMVEEGYSNVLLEVLRHQEAFAATWYDTHYKEAQSLLDIALQRTPVDSRMQKNAAALLGTFLFFEQRLGFAFSRHELLQEIATVMEAQQRQRLSGNDASRFWSALIYAAQHRQFVQDVHYRVENGTPLIAFYWDEVFGIYSKAHKEVFGEFGQPSSTLLGKLEQSPAWVGSKRSVRIGDRKSSAYYFDMDKTGTALRELLVPVTHAAAIKTEDEPVTEELTF